MLGRFLRVFGPGASSSPGAIWSDPTLLAAPGYAALAPRVAGINLGGGLLRFVNQAGGPIAQQAVNEAFPQFSERAVPFARDWLGRHFALDRARKAGETLALLLLEPGSGEVFEIDDTFEEFLDGDLIEAPDTYLESDLFDSWLRAGGGVPNAEQCVGFKVPLFLGGSGSVENLELSDVQVYWGICGQLWAATKDLPTGTSITGAELE